jgi:two-component system C4-dicarboxylate transport sensor histidine kinase DctB
VSLAAAVRNVLLLLEHRIRAEKVKLRIEVSESLRVNCDPNRLEQVLLNLCANAMDAMQGSGDERELAVSTEPGGQRVRVRVADTGSGIAPALMSRLFEPFFTTKPAGQGLGLGLVISSKIVHEFGGSLLALPGEVGMVFEFDLELAKHV